MTPFYTVFAVIGVVAIFAFIIVELVRDIARACTTLTGWYRNAFIPATESGPFCVAHIIIMVVVAGICVIYLVTSPEAIHEIVPGVSGTTVNIYGAALAKVHSDSSNEWRVWDPTDVAEPAAENTAFFITTKRKITGLQTQGDCMKSNVKCNTDSECLERRGDIFESGRGIFTGSCVKGFCAVLAWCPKETDEYYLKNHTEVLYDKALHFQIYIYSDLYIEYPDGTSRTYSNIVTNPLMNGKRCTYNKDGDYNCPYFDIMDILNNVTNHSSEKIDDMIQHGGVIAIRLKWLCDTSKTECMPKYTFTQLNKQDNYPDKDYHYTDASHSFDSDSRKYTKSTGILFIIQIDGSGYRYSAWNVIVFAASTFTILKSSKNITEFGALIILIGKSVLCLIRAARDGNPSSCRNSIRQSSDTEENDQQLIPLLNDSRND